MKYKAVFWDIDGTLYDNSGGIPEDEKDVLSFSDPLLKIPDRKLNYWVPYNGLAELMSQIPKQTQGIITNGYDRLQRDKLRLLGLDVYVNPELIFTSYGEAERILQTTDHPLLVHAGRDPETRLDRITTKTQKPNKYMFEKALSTTGYSPEECVMIGDGWQDLVGARNVGMKTIYIAGSTKHLRYDERRGIITVLRKNQFNPDYKVTKGYMSHLASLLF